MYSDNHKFTNEYSFTQMKMFGKISLTIKIFIFLLVLFEKKSYSEPQVLQPFSLIGVDGKTYSNSDVDKKKLLALVFLSNHCKISQLFQNHLIELSHKFRKEVVILAISPNYEHAILPDELAYSDFGDSFEEMKKRAIRKKYNFPYLYDGEKQTITKSLGVKITPTVYLYNNKRELFYVGRIGNIDNPNNIDTSDLYHAILSGLKNDSISLKRTKVFGTSIKTKDHLYLAEQVRQRYSDESIKLSNADARKLNFYLNHNTHKPKLFYVWQTNDINVRENLIKLSFLYKIFRKRGFRLITVCIAKDEADEAVIKALLEKSQLSSTNFISYGHNISPLAKIIPAQIDKLTPYYRLLGASGNKLIGDYGEISKDDLRFQILRALDNKL